MFEGSNNTHDTGQNSVVGIHGLERLFDTDTILDQNNHGVLADDRFELLSCTGGSLNALVCCYNICEVHILQAWVRRSGNGYRQCRSAFCFLTESTYRTSRPRL